MLSLESSEWSILSHAYGPADDIPDKLILLRDALIDPAQFKAAWDQVDFWSSLFHQYSVYSATFAAIPYIIEFANALPTEQRAELIAFVGSCVACSTLPRTPVVTPMIESAFRSALEQAIPLTVGCIEHESDEVSLRHLFAALAALRGHHALSHILRDMDCSIECPKCGAYIEAKECNLNLEYALKLKE